MLVSTKDQGLGRRRRSYSHSHICSMSKAARSSKLSLLSAISTQSTGSNGSTSTVTQESYNKSRSETSRRRKSSKRRKETSRSKTPLMEALEEAISEGEDEHEDVDVFAFLVEDAGTQREDESDDVKTKALAEDITPEKDVSGQRLHSDSGISMDDGSIVLGQTTLKPLLSILPEHRPLDQRETSQVRFDWTWPDVPKPKHPSITAAESTHQWAGVEYATQSVLNGTNSPQGFCFTPDSPESRRPSFSNFDRSASIGAAVSSHSLRPPFRGFTQTCQQVLLDLQQEVSELESELKQLEAYLRTISPVETGPAGTSDRRGSWQWRQHPSDLYALRSDITGRLHLRLEHYYQLLLLSQKVDRLKATSAASPAHVERFRAKLKEAKGLSTPSKEALLAVLSDEADLLTLDPNETKTRMTSFNEHMGRIVLGVAVLIAAVTLQIVSGLHIKLLIGIQMVGMIVALCLPLRN